MKRYQLIRQIIEAERLERVDTTFKTDGMTATLRGEDFHFVREGNVKGICLPAEAVFEFCDWLDGRARVAK